MMTPQPPTTSAQAAPPPAALNPGVGSTLWRTLERFDVDHDGKLSPSETYTVFRSVGFSPTWAWVSALSTAIWRGPMSCGRLTLTIDIARLGVTLVKGQTRAWDRNGDAIPAAVEQFLVDVDKDGTGRITLDVLRARVASDAKLSLTTSPPRFSMLRGFTRKRRFVEAFSCWVQLTEVAGHRDEAGTRYLTRDQVRSVFDGTMFDMIFSQFPRTERVSAGRIVKELLGGMRRA